MKKILSLSVMALLLMGLVGGGTWAYLDTERRRQSLLPFHWTWADKTTNWQTSLA